MFIDTKIITTSITSETIDIPKVIADFMKIGFFLFLLMNPIIKNVNDANSAIILNQASVPPTA
ncbi:hypothetical protein bthur0012_35470 [Bacillus thuringiensis serovar pulsiensis BGSC 4CC1]|nr:hypothetical protein bthur0012_35470 [Bacillus thuringiensis serovar pulsiensis BGSC 4CC1]